MSEGIKLPVGIENFEEIRSKGYYYVDKTKLIEQLFDSRGKVNLFTRPRRFGKTLNMSMLKSFFEIGADSALFEGLYISHNKQLWKEHMGKYPVIFLSLKGIEGLTFLEAKKRFVDLVRREAERFYFLKDSTALLDIDRKKYSKLLGMTEGEENSECQTAHCGRCKTHFIFGETSYPIVPNRNLPQILDGLTAHCCSLV